MAASNRITRSQAKRSEAPAKKSDESEDGMVETKIGRLMLTCPERYRHLVVHCKKKKFDVYCGRKNPSMPSIGGRYPYGNPFKMDREEDRQDVIRSYALWVSEKPELLLDIQKNLKGLILACWCAPKACHCDILVQIANDESLNI